MSKFIALVDGSIYSQSVCDHAAWIARRTGSDVEVVHVIGRRQATGNNLSGSLALGARSTLLEELAEMDAQMARLDQQRGRVIVDDAKARIEENCTATVTERLRTGDVVETVAECEKEADLILVGKRGEAADFAKLHLGSNLERIVRAAHKPVLVASRTFKPVERFLIAYDGGTSAMKAVEHIAHSTLYSGLDCVLLMVGDDDAATRKKLEGAEAQLRGAGYTVDARILPGTPETTIAETVAAENIGLLVMGAYGHSRIRNLIIGSTTTEMIRACHVPVALYR